MNGSNLATYMYILVMSVVRMKSNLTKLIEVHLCIIPQVQTIVSEAAKKASASEHTERLARAKHSVGGPFREPQWQVSDAAKKARASDRILDLSRPKKQAEDYQPCRNIEWKVSNGAKNAVASTR